MWDFIKLITKKTFNLLTNKVKEKVNSIKHKRYQKKQLEKCEKENLVLETKMKDFQ